MCKESWSDDLRVVRTSREPREHGRLGRAGTGVEKRWRVMRGEFSKNGTPPRRVPGFQPKRCSLITAIEQIASKTKAFYQLV